MLKLIASCIKLDQKNSLKHHISAQTNKNPTTEVKSQDFQL